MGAATPPWVGRVAKESAGHRPCWLSLSASTLCALLDYWIDKLPEEFCKTEHLPLLKQVKTYLIVNMPYSDLLVRVHNLQTQLQAEVASDSEDSDEEASAEVIDTCEEEDSGPGALGDP